MRPVGMDVAGRILPDVEGPRPVRAHDVNLLVAIPVRDEGDRPVVLRPVGPVVVRVAPGQLHSGATMGVRSDNAVSPPSGRVPFPSVHGHLAG